MKPSVPPKGRFLNAENIYCLKGSCLGVREVQEGGDMGIYVYTQLIHLVIQQKLTQRCKAIILQ